MLSSIQYFKYRTNICLNKFQQLNPLKTKIQQCAFKNFEALKNYFKNISSSIIGRVEKSDQNPTNIVTRNNIALNKKDLTFNQLDRLIVELENWKQDSSATGDKARACEIITFAFVTKSNELNLSELHLNKLPPIIGQLTQLREVNLNRNELQTLPSEICQLINLTSLDISDNKLKTLPSEICQLINLTSLYTGSFD
jgi:Leucine-rich repeat (LRR) protein